MTWIVRLLLTVGLWFALLGAAPASAAPRDTAIATSAVAAVSGLATRTTCQGATPAVQMDTALADEHKFDKFAILLTLTECERSSAGGIDRARFSLERLVSSRPRRAPNARAPPPVRCAEPSSA